MPTAGIKSDELFVSIGAVLTVVSRNPNKTVVCKVPNVAIVRTERIEGGKCPVSGARFHRRMRVQSRGFGGSTPCVNPFTPRTMVVQQARLPVSSASQMWGESKSDLDRFDSRSVPAVETVRKLAIKGMMNGAVLGYRRGGLYR